MPHNITGLSVLSMNDKAGTRIAIEGAENNEPIKEIFLQSERSDGPEEFPIEQRREQ